MEHNVIVIDNHDGKATSIKNPSQQELQALEDCEEYSIIDPLQNIQWVEGAWQPIPTGRIEQNGSIVTVG